MKELSDEHRRATLIRYEQTAEIIRQCDLAVNFLTEICKWQKLRDWQLMHMEINEAAEFVEAISTIKESEVK